MRRAAFTWRHLAALVTLADVLGFVGLWLYRGTLRRTLGVAAALMAVAVIGGKGEAGEPRLGLEGAATGAGIIFIASCLGGLTLMALAGSLSRSALTLGEAKGINLLEDMKKHRKEIHRDALWSRVFRYEQESYPADERLAELEVVNDRREALLDMCDPHRRREMGAPNRLAYERIIRDLGRTEEGWRIAFGFGMQVPMGRAELMYRLRFDVAQVKDWYDGAPFHHTDCKLREQYDANEDLVEARRDAGYGLRDRWAHVRRRMMQNLWFRSITRAVHVRTARACAVLDRRYAPHRFSIDHFLWPSRLVDQRVAEQLGAAALEDLRSMRRGLFQRVFHTDVGLAHQLMHKAIYPDFFGATVLRRRYDPEYLLGELGECWARDIRRHTLGFSQKPGARLRRVRVRRRARRREQRLREFLETNPSLRPGSWEGRRALRIAYHADYEGLRGLIGAGGDRGEIERIVRGVEEDAGHFTRKLLAVRVHHELARLELEDYGFYLERILR